MVFPTPRRIDAFDVGREARLMYPGHGVLAPDYVRIPSHGGLAGKLGLPPPPWPVNGCFLLRGAGVVFAIDVPYEAAIRYTSDTERDNVVVFHVLNKDKESGSFLHCKLC
jgi:hypothetical protein